MSGSTSNPFLDERGWPIVDRLLADLFRQRVRVAGEPVYAGTVFADDEPDSDVDDPDDDTAAPLAFPGIRVQRLPGGGINADGYEDISRIEIMTVGRDRPESDSMTAQVRQLMSDLSDDEYAEVGIDRIFEETGPGRIPDPNDDVRVVPTTWSVTARQQ